MQLSLHLAAPRPRAAKGRNYFDTTRLPLADLARAIARAEQQDDAILAAFRCHLILTPSRCHEIVSAGRPILLTSVRRSIATLTEAGALEKLAKRTPGPYGAPEHLWQLVTRHTGAIAA
jgi:hypothetical protein